MLAAVSPPSRLEAPAHLPGEARQLLRTRMASHAQDMSALMSAIMVLRYAEIEERANSIAHEARFAAPHSQDATELNSALPEKFFVRQDELRAGARSLSAAARDLDPYRVAAAYGRLSEECVRCHADYRPATPQK